MTEVDAFVSLPPPTEAEPDRVPDGPICVECDKPIFVEPGARGRKPKRHPECKPAPSGPTGVPATRRTTGKAAAEAAQITAAVRSVMLKGALGLSAVDPFDGFCVLQGIGPVTGNLESILATNDRLRKELLTVRQGGSWVGLVIAVLGIAAPIAAHHGLIPGEQVSKTLEQLPALLHKLNTRMEEGEAGLRDMSNDMLRKLRDTKAAANGATADKGS